MKTFKEYQREAARTAGSDLSPENRKMGLSCAGIGVAGEAGEVADVIKKHLHHGAALDETKLRKELGDIAAGNVEKLRARYPEGFTTADSIARRDEGGSK